MPGRRAVMRAAEALARRVRRARSRVVICNIAVPRLAEWRLSVASGLVAVPLTPTWRTGLSAVDPLFDERRTGLASLRWGDEFERLTQRLLDVNVQREAEAHRV